MLHTNKYHNKYSFFKYIFDKLYIFNTRNICSVICLGFIMHAYVKTPT